jgi:hypothetical protein
VALVLTSASEGAGKNAFTEKLQAVVGVKEPHDLSIATADADKLFGRFNSSLSHKLLVILNEADVSGPYSAKIKGLVTDPTVEIEAKFVDPYTETSVHRFIFTSNSEKPVAATVTGRRYKMYDVADTYTGPATDESKRYFQEIRDVPAAALALLLFNRDIRDYSPRGFGKGAADYAAYRANFTAVEKQLDEQLRQGYVLEERNENGLTRTWMFGGAPVPKALMSWDWAAFWRAVGGKKGDMAKEVRTKTQGQRVLCVQFEPLRVCRQVWSDKFYGTLPDGWGDDEEAGVSRTVAPDFS